MVNILVVRCKVFYGTLDNQGLVIFSDIKVIKYYKISLVHDTALVFYEENVVSCEFKSINQLPIKKS